MYTAVTALNLDQRCPETAGSKTNPLESNGSTFRSTDLIHEAPRDPEGHLYPSMNGMENQSRLKQQW